MEINRSESSQDFKLDPIPRPVTNDAAATATFTLLDGHAAGGDRKLNLLHDGRLPAGPDDPGANFFLQDGNHGGRLKIDLGKVISIKSFNSYSWHPNARSPQVYTLLAAKGDENAFNDSPKAGTDPKTVGWKQIARVDTRPKGIGGQVAVSVSHTDGAPLGEFRYLLLDIETPNPQDAQSNTFFSEIDVIDANGPPPTPVPARVRKTYNGPGGYQYTVDLTIAPDLVKWTDEELMPMVYQWYPKLIAMLPSDGYTAPKSIKLTFKDDMGGTPAYAMGNDLSLSLPFFRSQLKGEAKGCVVHEMSHIVQGYGRASATNPHPSPTPGWVVEGIADYIRWFLYEPQSKGAEITKRNIANAKYNDSYRTTANFINWVVLTYDKDFLRKINAAARAGTYSEKIWQDSTKKTSAELGQEWHETNAKRLGVN